MSTTRRDGVPTGPESAANPGPDDCPAGLQRVTLNHLSGGLALRRNRDRSPDVKIRNDHQAARQQQAMRRAVDELIKSQPWRLYYAQDENGQTPLHVAISRCFEDVALYLIEFATHPRQLNVRNDFAQSALYLAVERSQPRVVRRLIVAGADPTLTDADGDTPLHVACRNGDLACVRALTDPIEPEEKSLLPSGADAPSPPQNLELTNYNKGQTCLHLAAIDDRIHIARLLVKLGARVEARERLEGRTALHLAIKHNSRSVYSFLLRECKSCLDTPTYAGLTAYQIALKDGDYYVAEELISHGAKPEPLPLTDSESSDDE